jgi:hypothetical protein
VRTSLTAETREPNLFASIVIGCMLTSSFLDWWIMKEGCIGILVEAALMYFGLPTAIIGGCLMAIAAIVFRLVWSKMKSETGTEQRCSDTE